MKPKPGDLHTSRCMQRDVCNDANIPVIFSNPRGTYSLGNIMNDEFVICICAESSLMLCEVLTSVGRGFISKHILRNLSGQYIT